MLNQTALVTGAARGIGKAIALQLAKDGYQVAITDLGTQKSVALETVKEIEALGRKSLFIEADSSKRSEIFKAVDETHKKLGGFNIIVNNAGVASVGSITDISEEELKRVLNINVGGVLNGIQAAAAKFVELGDQPGKIINAGSIVSHQAFPIMGAYSASKFAVKGLTQAAAKELAAKKITVNAYCPGIVLTPMWDLIDLELGKINGLPKGENLQNFVKGIALGRGEEAQDVANLVSFLASEKADYITGQAYNVDGGIVYV